MNTPAVALPISAEDRRAVERLAQASKTPQRTALHARAILLAAEGLPNSGIAARVGVSRQTVITWRQRFQAEGTRSLAGVAPGRGRKTSISPEQVARIVHDTLHTTPATETHWSCRTMAKAHGVSAATIQRIWDAHGLEPHRTKTFKLSRDKEFVEKLTDIVGLYLDPPERAVVLCVDEKSQIQALDRTQPGLPMKRGRCGTMTHDYKRHGTTTLFAALNTLDGTVIGQCLSRHRHQEFLRFLRHLDREFPPDLDLHLVLDNYATHKHKDVRVWLDHHPRFILHFTPTSTSWLNLVERWFANLTNKRLRRGVFRSVDELITAINDFVSNANLEPRPFSWSATPEQIIAKVEKCQAIYGTQH